MDEFKEFLKTIPSIKQDVLNGRYTWQQLYEIFVMYGKDDKFWLPYKTGNSGCGGFGSSNWFAIVLVVFLLLIICGNSRIRVG